jgi:catechol 2,3-dioxygenase-like lactoylglutathione lyase family enzyme
MLGPEGQMCPKTDGILESSLYVSDVPSSVRFYEETFGFRVISEFGERGCAMHAGARQVLLLFKKGASRAIQSPHDGDGELHVAFAIPSAELANWESWLPTRGIAVEEKKTWELGGSSLYFRDPDRHLIELATPGTWSVY